MAERRWWRTMTVTVAVVLVVLLALVGAVWALQRSLIYFPDRSAPPPAGDVLPGGQDVTFTTGDGLGLQAWHVPAPAGGATVLVAPGNGGNRAGRAELGRALADRGLGVLLMDYRGYGGNPGSPTQDGIARDARAARNFLIEEAGVEQEALVYLGESLGAAVVTEMATEHPPAALVLRSPFTSLSEVGRAAYGVPVGWLLRDRYPLREQIREVSVPVVVVAGGADTIVPTEQSRAVARAAQDAGAPTRYVEVPGADHNEGRLAHGTALLDALSEVAPGGAGE